MKTRITEKESEYLFRMVDANKVNNESKLDFIFNIQSLTIKGCVRLCVCHVLSQHNFSAVSDINI